MSDDVPYTKEDDHLRFTWEDFRDHFTFKKLEVDAPSYHLVRVCRPEPAVKYIGPGTKLENVPSLGGQEIGDLTQMTGKNDLLVIIAETQGTAASYGPVQKAMVVTEEEFLAQLQ